MPNPKEFKKDMTTREVAMVLDMSPDTVAEFARKGILRAASSEGSGDSQEGM